MTNKYPYPEQEHYVPPETEVEVLQDELHYYPETRNLEVCLDGLAKLYGLTPLGGSLAMASRLLFMANAQAGVETIGDGSSSRQLDNEFYAGGIMAIHSTIRPLTPHQSGYVFSSTGLLGVDLKAGIDSPDEVQAETAQQAIEAVKEFRAERWERLYGKLPSPLKDAILDVSLVMCKERIPGTNPKARRHNFMAGYVYLSSYVGETLQTYEQEYADKPPRWAAVNYAL